ncbi:hypothetical protein SCUCBS95973_007970 [Sporothrix curviconia]|uniref:Aminoglycoside phosphotransferase domain-containing protein n=1 Tax=Sporothrix curviconia TaxID=1260050 RepID=A0ABP0CK81_9PEZI
MDAAPINDTIWMRLVTLLLCRLGYQQWYRKWQKKWSPGLIYISSKLCLRVSERTRLNEARALQLVKASTSIPVPKVYCSFKHRGLVYILMERMPGKSLSDGWVYRSDESKAKILAQLKPMIAELRKVPRSPAAEAPARRPNAKANANVISGIDGGQFYDGNLPNKRFWGPFATSTDFHRELRNGLMAIPDQYTGETYDKLRRLITLQENYPLRPAVLTHGDLSANNIMAEGDKVTGIIDWETAAWMPDYWEYANAWFVNPYNPYWQEEVPKFLDKYAQGFEIEMVRRQLCDQY